ncbi:TNF receptor-associated factor 2-like [Watersipora subatra]|uniref:TNF receptor-associated factor 2-like n=1 Tax=Watersipora subatra TaxID=2589382 RepID=UPI00355B2A0C
MNGDSETLEYKRRHTVDDTEEKFRDLQIETKKRREMKSNEMEQQPLGFCSTDRPDFDDDIQPEEICCACKMPALQPIATRCGHTYCGHYMDSLKRENVSETQCLGTDEDSDDKHCHEKILVLNQTVDKALDRSINNKLIKCKNHALGCSDIFKLRKLAHHLDNICLFANVRCPNCKREQQRGQLEEHKAVCRSKACAFADIGCEHVSEPEGAASSSSSQTPEHSIGLHLALIYQLVASLRSASEFSAETLDSAMTRHSKSVTCQEQALSMLSNPNQQNSEAIAIQELRTNYGNKRGDAKKALEGYNRLVHVEYPAAVAEPVLRLKHQSQWLEHQEEDRNEFMTKFMQETNEIPILLNHGQMIFKLKDFSEKRMKAIKGELKRGVHGPLFYTHEFGYLMVPIVYPNGDGAGTGTHLSIFIAIKKGKFDALLPWPVVGRITISVLSQRRVGRETVKHSFRTDVASLSYHRPMQEMNQASGIPKALDLNLLKQPSDFLVEDTLFIQIVVEPQITDK